MLCDCFQKDIWITTPNLTTFLPESIYSLQMLVPYLFIADILNGERWEKVLVNLCINYQLHPKSSLFIPLVLVDVDDQTFVHTKNVRSPPGFLPLLHLSHPIKQQALLILIKYNPIHSLSLSLQPPPLSPWLLQYLLLFFLTSFFPTLCILQRADRMNLKKNLISHKLTPIRLSLDV